MTLTRRSAAVVIVAAGRGERFGDSGKVLAEAGGKPLLCWSVEAALSASATAEIIVVAGPHNLEAIAEVLRAWFPDQVISLSTGGERRQDSVLAGLMSLATTSEVAIIHDAARPLATAAMFDAVALAAMEHGAAITAIPVTDTIKEVDGDSILRTIDRSSLQAAQTPQAYRRSLLEQAFAHASEADVPVTDEAQLLESLGHTVVVVNGARTNLKVTVPEDLAMVDFLLSRSWDGPERDVSS